MSKILSKINVYTLCLIAVIVKLVVFGGNVADSIAVLGLSGFLGWEKYVEIRRDNLVDKANEQLSRISQEFAKLSTEVSTLKMRMGMEQTTRKLTNVEKPEQQQKRFF